MGPLDPEALEARASGVRLLILDVDGVLTDGGIVLDDSGREYKRFHVRDGHGIKLLQQQGISVAIVTGRRSAVVEHRAWELGIREVHQGAVQKGPALEEVLEACGVAPAEAAMIGDDVVDLPILSRTGLAVAVADAHPAVRERAHWVTAAGGGRGAVREVADRILRARGLEEKVLSAYLEPEP